MKKISKDKKIAISIIVGVGLMVASMLAIVVFYIRLANHALAFFLLFGGWEVLMFIPYLFIVLCIINDWKEGKYDN